MVVCLCVDRDNEVAKAGVTLPSLSDSWRGSSRPPSQSLLEEAGIDDGWMDVKN